MNGTGTDIMCVCRFLSCNFGEHGTNVTRFYALCIVLCHFLFLLWYRFLWTILQYHHKERSHELWCLRLSIQIVTSSLYLSSNFRLSTVAGIRTMTLHGISSPPCVIGERRLCVDVNCASISAPLSSKYFVVRLISCGRWPTARGSWLEHVLIAKISNGFPLSW